MKVLQKNNCLLWHSKYNHLPERSFPELSLLFLDTKWSLTVLFEVSLPCLQPEKEFESFLKWKGTFFTLKWICIFNKFPHLIVNNEANKNILNIWHISRFVVIYPVTLIITMLLWFFICTLTLDINTFSPFKIVFILIIGCL